MEVNCVKIWQVLRLTSMSIELLSLEKILELASQYGYLAVFLGIAIENTGIPIPGETITIVGGFLAGNGELNYWLVLGTAIAGAVVGDNFGYLIGKIGGWAFLLRLGKFLRIKQERLEEVREKFSQNAAKAVFFGRFIALLRIFAGPLAGIAEMPYGKFFICNLGGAVAWASVMVSLSYFLGKIIPLEQLVNLIARFGIFALLLVVAWIFVPLWWESQKSRINTD